MGVNPGNYDMLRTKNNEEQKLLPDLLNQYFGADFDGSDTPEARHRKLLGKMGTFAGDVDKLGAYTFAGIKLYPPLGFNPWPDVNEGRDKVELLYQRCIDKNIPITTHCSNGGYVTNDKAEQFTSPDTWEKVLKNYGKLKINFAHFGMGEDDWRDKIMKLMVIYPNVYADLSYAGIDDDFFEDLEEMLDGADSPFKETVPQRLLFGSDFMMHLMEIDSYADYLTRFEKRCKNSRMYCSSNPERFLFE